MVPHRKHLKDYCRRCNDVLTAETVDGHDVPDATYASLSEWQEGIPSPAASYRDPASLAGAGKELPWSYLERPRLAKDDMDFLERKNAFKVPERALLIELLTSYCNWIHPQLPFLDLHSVLGAVVDDRNNGDRPKISLLLFQAVLFAGAAHMDEKTFRLFGFPSRTDAQDVLFRRVKVGHLLCRHGHCME